MPLNLLYIRSTLISRKLPALSCVCWLSACSFVQNIDPKPAQVKPEIVTPAVLTPAQRIVSAPLTPIKTIVAQRTHSGLIEQATDRPLGISVGSNVDISVARAYPKSTLKPNNGNGFAVVAYHRVGLDSSKYTVSPSAFVAQMEYLRVNNYSVISYRQMLDYLDYGASLPSKAVLLTVDDGHRTSYSEIYPVLTRYQYPAVFFPYSDYIDNGGLTRSMMREMQRSGLVEFHLHTKTHAAMTLQHDTETDENYEARIQAELTEPLSKLEQIIGVKPRGLAYPYGKVNRRVERIVRGLGIQEGFTVNCDSNDRNTNRARLNRCTLLALDTLEDFGDKLSRPAVALARHARAQQQLPKYSSAKPEFLGNISDREFVRGVEIEPFTAYFVDPEGDELVYRISKLPDGLLLDSRTGLISGTPSEAGQTGGIKVIAIDRTGQRAGSNSFKMTIY